jgi:hypothetical protein
MKSPFPGMDPYIEACGLWEGFHNRLIHRIDDALAQILPRGYTIDVASRSYVVLMGNQAKNDFRAMPDVAVTQPAPGKRPRKNKSNVALADPGPPAEFVQMRPFVAEKFKERFIEIYLQREERILVTSIEILSPSNKRSGTEGWDEYDRKRQAMLLGSANFVEIDLLLGGEKMPMLDPWPQSPYTLLVSRMADSGYCSVWPAHFLRRLPVIPVPLVDPDPDLTLDLQPLIDHTYTLGRYVEEIDYSRPLSPTLSEADAASVRDLLKQPSPRSAKKGKNRS